ncbi:MAG: hypothetical protein SGJ20_08350 [Planctomycetota bacterium]|nr:hypothetical protein [Planctomycetota bacterium]
MNSNNSELPDIEWRPIVRGGLIASVGAVACSMLVVSLSAFYTAQWMLGAGTMIAAVAGGICFSKTLDPFLISLELRDAAEVTNEQYLEPLDPLRQQSADTPQVP